ncbi:MAG TPA: sigma-54 dependent transcriptional regulator [Vicinamibacterales bacterium]|nr:sigma-54 dependent transcriptional regulator [Vicinamibacterales bacterium]
MLMLDRYLVAGGRALDLATGATIRWRLRRDGQTSAPPLFTVRGRAWLIDFDVRGKSRIEVWERPTGPCGSSTTLRASGSDVDAIHAFRAALADARDGCPRALDLAEVSGAAWAKTQRLMAREARLAGFVPLAADAFGAVLSQGRWRFPSWLKERAIVVFATDSRLSPDASLALFRLATKDARPHLIVRGVTGEPWRPRLVAASTVVHDGAAGEALTPAALVERADVLRAGGQVVDAESLARWSMLLSESDGDRAAARCELARCLISQRRWLEARSVLLPVESGEAHGLREHIGQAAIGRIEPAMVEAFLDILRICQDIEDPIVALTRVAMRLQEILAASRVAFVLRDRDRPHAVAYAGARLPMAAELTLAIDVLDTGVSMPFRERGPGMEMALPIRYAASVVGTLWCQWSVGMPLVAQDAAAVLELAAAAAAPAVHDIGERHRAPQAAAAVIPELVGQSAAMEQVRQAVLKAAASPFPVLIEGESGSGKELVARAIHGASVRRARTFCALNCAAIADDLVEAELFGHTRGAFTGAVAERLGLFEEAQGGTLFLDEVAELSARVQAKLLRTLQEGEVRRLGESSTRKVDARIVAATNRPLGSEASAGRFRNDLRYRLDVLRLTIPPLRERLDDLPLLVRHIWSVLAQRTGSRAVLSASAMAQLGSYDWPGNVRELQNVLASIMVSGAQRGVIGPQGLPAHITRATAMAGRATLAEARREFEERYVRAALARAAGRPVIAARELGVSRQGLRKLTARLGLPIK